MLGKESKQPSFADLLAAGRLSERHFLTQIEAAIDWQPFEKKLAKLYHPSVGRPGYPPLMLFKALLLQQWYGLSDPEMEEAIGDRLSFQRFLRLSLHESVPDETTICKFRGLLARRGLTPEALPSPQPATGREGAHRQAGHPDRRQSYQGQRQAAG